MAEMRLEVLLEAARSGETVTEVCRRHGISRKTYYAYLKRFRSEGVEGLEPRSRQPINQPQRMDAVVEETLCLLRKDHPKWGARRIRAELTRRGIKPPAVSSIHRALVRNNLVAVRPSRPRPATQRFERASPNELWQIDATRLLLADETEVWVMDMLDDHARFCLAARVGKGPTGAAAWDAFEWAVKRYGLPTQLLSDNGTCFTGRLVGGEVEFERRLWNLGVKTVHSRPYHPQTCGKLERFHRTMKEWLDELPKAQDPEELQAQLDSFRKYYNEERPHQGIADETPAERYASASPLQAPEPLHQQPTATYPSAAILRKVNSNGSFGYQGTIIHIGAIWAHHRVRITEVGGVVHVYFGEQLIRSLVLDPDCKFHGLGKNRPIRRSGSGKEEL
jgi:transposase InsO family protein